MNSNNVALTDPSLRATRRFWQYLDEIPQFWRPGTGREDEQGDFQRIWAIDDDGRVTRVPAAAIEGFGKRIGKDSYVYSASIWCSRHRPVAVVLGMECWVCTLQPEAQQRLMRFEGGTPDMMVEENRQRLIQKYGAKLGQQLLIQGEIRGRVEPVFRMHPIVNQVIGGASPADQYKQFKSRFMGMLDPEGWAPPPGDFR